MRILFSIILTSLFFHLQAQDQFQRTYPATDRDVVNVAMSTSGQGGFYTLDYFSTDLIPAGVMVSKLSPKGDILWSKDITIEDYESYSLNGDIIGLGPNGCTFSVSQVNDMGLVENKILVNMTSDGALNWLRTIRTEDEMVFPAPLKLIDDNAGGAYHLGPGAMNNLDQGTYISRTDENGVVMWDNNFAISDNALSTYFDAASVSVDGHIIVSGTEGLSSVATDGSVVLAKMDTFGMNQWANTYTPVLDAGYTLDNFDVSAGLDSTIWSIGRIFSGGQFLSYIINTDEDGQIRWSKSFDLSDSTNTVVNYPLQIEHLEDGNVVILFKYFNPGTGEEGEASTKMDTTGNVIWTKLMKRNNSSVMITNPMGFILNTNSDLVTTDDGGFAYTSFTNDASAFLIKATTNGEAFCEEDITGDFLTDLVFEVDAATLNFNDSGTQDTLMAEAMDFLDHDVPTATLLDTTYCPNDPIMLTLDATQENAISYLWETGETTATLDVTTDDSYKVTVTFDTLTCWILCDTATISRSSDPTVDILIDASGLCELGTLNLLASATGNPPFSYEWNDGSTDQLLTVDGPGDYGVTIVDNCDLMASANITLTEADFDSGFDFDVILESLICLSGVPSLEITATNFNGTPTNILWSTGETTPTIVVSQPGDYSVVITDECNQEQERTINVSPDDLALPFSFDVNAAELVCEDGNATITLSLINIIGVSNDYVWSNGDTGISTIVSEPGVYTVTGTDPCGTVVMVDYTVLESDFDTDITLEFDLIQGPLICENGASSITISVDSITGGDIFSYEWSTGSDNPTLVVGVAGEYSVTVTDICGNEISESITLGADDFESLYDIPYVLAHWYLCESNSINIFTEPLDLLNVHSYEWSTGETSSGINVTTSGVYSVTVTDLCGEEYIESYTIEDENFQLQFELQYGLLCEPRGFDITLEFWTSDIASYLWSDGSTDDRIFVTDPGDYSLTLTDNCGNETERSIDIPDSALPVDLEPSITFDCLEDDCGLIQLCAVIEDDLVPVTLEWTGPNGFSNGDNCIFLTENEIGTLTLTVTNECDPFTATYDLDQSDFDCIEAVELEPGIFFDCLADDSTTVRICAVNDQDLEMTNFVWQTPNGTMTTGCLDLNNDAGSYGNYTLVSFEAACNEYSINEVFELTESSFLCGEKPCLKFPNVFLPGRVGDNIINESNLNFGPVQTCPIDDYNLKIFNRWGKKLFETEDIDEEWDGVLDGKILQSDVYMFVATWLDFDGEEQKAKGDITLIR